MPIQSCLYIVHTLWRVGGTYRIPLGCTHWPEIWQTPGLPPSSAKKTNNGINIKQWTIYTPIKTNVANFYSTLSWLNVDRNCFDYTSCLASSSSKTGQICCIHSFWKKQATWTSQKWLMPRVMCSVANGCTTLASKRWRPLEGRMIYSGGETQCSVQDCFIE